MHHTRGALVTGDARPEAVPGVRDDGADRLLVCVEAEAVDSLVLVPKRRLETPFEFVGLLTQGCGAPRLAQCLEDLSHAALGVEYIALQLAERDRRVHVRTVGVDFSLAGVLPAPV